jgi:outer membrane lipopolysaccharide assembly protein LptE/RlpB
MDFGDLWIRGRLPFCEREEEVTGIMTGRRANIAAGLRKVSPLRGAASMVRPSTGTVPARLRRLLILAILALCCGCGYHMAGHGDRLPATLRTIAVPGFKNQTQTYRIEQILTRDVVREFNARTTYRILNGLSDSADATLRGTVVSATTSPLTYDSVTGRASSELVTITLKISLVDHSGRVLFENQNYTFRDVYQIGRNIASFFDEETPALQRMSHDFARSLVSDILEAY